MNHAPRQATDAVGHSWRASWKPLLTVVPQSMTPSCDYDQKLSDMRTISCPATPQNPRANLTGPLAEQAGLESKMVPMSKYDPKAVQESEPDA